MVAKNAAITEELNELQGLSDLNKFRSNLTQQQQPEHTTRNEPPPPVITIPRNPSNHARQPANPSGRQAGLSKTLGEIQNTSLQPPLNNTAGGGSPSWLHIYQSTGNQSERDLSSRLEHVSALGAILSSQNNPKAGTKDSSSANKATPEDNAPNDNVLDKTGKNNSKANGQPTWAKSKPKVTLDSMLNKPTFPFWKNK